MLADFHALMALQGLWRRIAASEANFNAIFSKMDVPNGIVRQWRDVLCPNGKTDRVTIDQAFVHGITKPPALIVELGGLEEYERLIGDGTLGSTGKMHRFLRSQVTVTVWAATKPQVQALSVLAIAMLTYAQGYFQERGYSGQGLVRGTDLNAWEELGAEKAGNFRRRVTWKLEREYQFPPLLGDEPVSTTIVIHTEDAFDAFGNPGQVSPREDI